MGPDQEPVTGGGAVFGDGVQVASQLEQLQKHTGVDEVMLVLTGHSPEIMSETVEQVARHCGMSGS